MNTNTRAVKRTFLLLVFLGIVLVFSYLGLKPKAKQKVLAEHTLTGISLTVDNFSNGATLRYDLPLLIGTVTNSSNVTVSNGDSVIRWTVNNGHWRAFVPLTVGSNIIHLSTDSGRTYEFTMYYVPQSNDKYIRMVYPMGSDSSGTFDAPLGEPNSTDAAVDRLALTGRLLQSLTAEFLAEAGGPRQTFRLLRDAEGDVVVDTPRSNLSVSELWSMDGIELWYHYYTLFGSYSNRNNIKDIAVMADTHYDASTGQLYAHTALGGGRLALFGGGTLYSYPGSVEEIESHLTDASAIESYLFPEYARREEYWATYTTSAGAILHEAGHSFGLDHPDNPQSGDIMYRGFDYINRAIVTYEPHWGSVNPDTNIMPRWTPEDVPTLTTETWLQSGLSGWGNGGPQLLPPDISISPQVITDIQLEQQTSQLTIPLDVQADWTDLSWQVDFDTSVFSTLSVFPLQGDGDAVITVDLAGYSVGAYSEEIVFTFSPEDMAEVSITVYLSVVIADQIYSTYIPITYY